MDSNSNNDNDGFITPHTMINGRASVEVAITEISPSRIIHRSKHSNRQWNPKEELRKI